MADALTTVTNIINSPPGQVAAGAALAGIVWKFFERVEAVLKDDTKLEIGFGCCPPHLSRSQTAVVTACPMKVFRALVSVASEGSPTSSEAQPYAANRHYQFTAALRCSGGSSFAGSIY